MKDAKGHGSNARGAAFDPAAAIRANAGGTRASRMAMIAAAQAQAKTAAHQAFVDKIGRVKGAAIGALRDENANGPIPAKLLMGTARDADPHVDLGQDAVELAHTGSEMMAAHQSLINGIGHHLGSVDWPSVAVHVARAFM